MTKTLLAVYGTLKLGGYNAYKMNNSTYLGVARLQPGTVLYDTGGYPALQQENKKEPGVRVELYEVDPATLSSLDRFEGHPSLFERRPVGLDEVVLSGTPDSSDVEAALDQKEAQVYFYNRGVSRFKRIGDFYPVGKRKTVGIN